MSTVEVDLNIGRYRAIREQVSQLPPKLKDASRQILDESMMVLLYRTRKRFLAEQDPDGQPWTPSRAGMIRRAGGYTYRDGKKYTGTGTLFESGRLFHSLQVYRTSLNVRHIGTDVPYAPFHQFGKGQWVRRFLGMNREDVALIAEILRKKLQAVLPK